ncbi:MAG: DUF58 domain-containing protein [Phycisphaerae bacterium]|nr:DUF58 domain-containing protein [Phycisphaerae bacterium]
MIDSIAMSTASSIAPLDSLPQPTRVRRQPSLDFSVTGLVYCAMMMFMGIAAINSQANLLFGVFGLMIGILLITIAINWLVLRKLKITRVLPENGVVAEPLQMSYQIENRKRYWPALSVTIAELDGADAFMKQPHAYMLHAAAKNTAMIPAELLPRRRGMHRLNRFQVSSSFPFGFIKRAWDREKTETLLIYPPVARVSERLTNLLQSSENSGASMRPRRGGADEFYGVKDYRIGENPRYIYWRRSARTGSLVSKEMTHVAPPRILLLVDTFLGTDPSPQRRADVERGLGMAASIVDHCLAMGMMLGMVARGSDWIHFPLNRGKRHRRDLLAALAKLPTNSQHDHQELVEAAYADQAASAATTVLVTPIDVRLSLGERARGGTVVVSAANIAARSWFTFDPRVDFDHMMPIEPTSAARLEN